MKIRVVSDLHVDVNDFMDFGFLDHTFDTDIIIIAGDTAGSSYKEISFLRHLRDNDVMTTVVCIGGNHLGYDYIRYRTLNAVLMRDNPLDQTKEDCIKQLKNNTQDVKYLENEWIEFKDYVIYGGTMYSNFKLYGSHIDACKNTAERWLNDFRYVYTFDKKQNIVRPVTSDDYIKWFNKFMRGLRKCIKETDKDIIVVSHFAPSIKSIDGKYLNKPNRLNSPGSELNAVYASPMEEFILNNPRIKLWCHGHVHDVHDYNIGQCHVVSYPYGYYHEHGIGPMDYMGGVIEV